jgi:hypothetical protein
MRCQQMGVQAEAPGHDLTYLAENDLIAGLDLPAMLTQPGAAVGGGHAGYRVYECQNGRVAVAALEPHFAARLCAAAGLTVSTSQAMLAPATQQTIATWLRGKTRRQIDQLARDKDIPLHTMA